MLAGVDLFSYIVPGVQPVFSIRKLMSFSSQKFSMIISLLGTSPLCFVLFFFFFSLENTLLRCGTSWTDSLIFKKNLFLPFFYIFDILVYFGGNYFPNFIYISSTF